MKKKNNTSSLLKKARKEIAYWEILKYKTKNLIDPVRLSFKLKEDPVKANKCPLCNLNRPTQDDQSLHLVPR